MFDRMALILQGADNMIRGFPVILDQKQLHCLNPLRQPPNSMAGGAFHRRPG